VPCWIRFAKSRNWFTLRRHGDESSDLQDTAEIQLVEAILVNRTGAHVLAAFAVLAIPGCLLGGSGLAGAPGESSCAACHGASTTPLSSTPGGNGVFMKFSGGATYTPGVVQSVVVTVTDPAFPAFGYQTSPRIVGRETTSSGGTLAPVDADAQFYAASSSSPLNWIAAGESLTGSPTNIFHFNWTPPDSGTVIFYVIGMGAIGSGNPQQTEHVYANTFTLTLAPAPPPPSITPGGIVPVFSTEKTIQPGEWVSIYGANLASLSAIWNGNFPKSLGGTSVTINGNAAYLWSVNATQINLQAPDDTATGSVPVVVTTASGAFTSTVTLARFAPSFSLLDSKHVSGIILRTDGSGSQGGGAYDIIGPTGNSLGYPTVAAKAGDTIALFAVGLGPTNPAVPAGQAFSGLAPTTNPLTLLINNVGVTPAFAGLSSAGLYQINLTVPAALGTGDVPVVATVGGVQTPLNVMISLQ
jgi:uncharacterized protein (TIGR03437 family)